MKVAEVPGTKSTASVAAPRPGSAGEPRANLRHLWAFIRVAELQSISRAGTEIHLSQPAISQAILRLEEDLGEQLFTRSPTGMHPTRMGEILCHRVERGFAALSRVVRTPTAGPEATVPAPNPSLLLRASQLAVLIALGTQGSLEGCARELGLTEKSASRNIRNLEERIGRTMVVRDGGAARLSRAGEAVARAGKIFFRELEMAREEMASEHGLAQGRLVVGALPLARSFIVPKAMVTIATRFPQVRVQLVEGPYSTLINSVRDGDIDILVGALRDPLEADEISQHLLFFERLCVVARSDHPCLSGARVKLVDLLRYPWVAPRSGSPARRQFDALMSTGPAPPTVLLEAASHIALRSILVESNCLSLISRHQIRYEEEQSQLTVVPVALDLPPRPVGYSVRANWQPTPLQSAFLAELYRATALSQGAEETR